jgi:hypothetical protein
MVMIVIRGNSASDLKSSRSLPEVKRLKLREKLGKELRRRLMLRNPLGQE